MEIKKCPVCQHEFLTKKKGRIYCSCACSGYRKRGKRSAKTGHAWLQYKELL